MVRQDRPKKPAIKWGYNLTPLKLGVHPLPCQSSQPFWMKHKSCIYILLYNILYTLIFCHICKYILNNIDIVQYIYIYISNKQKKHAYNIKLQMSLYMYHCLRSVISLVKERHVKSYQLLAKHLKPFMKHDLSKNQMAQMLANRLKMFTFK